MWYTIGGGIWVSEFVHLHEHLLFQEEKTFQIARIYSSWKEFRKEDVIVLFENQEQSTFFLQSAHLLYSSYHLRWYPIYMSLYYTIHEFQQWITMTIILSIDKLVSLKFRFQSFSEQKINYLSMSIPCMIEYITSKNSLSKNVHVYNYFSCRLDWQDSSMCNGYQQPKKGGWGSRDRTVWANFYMYGKGER